MADSDPLIGRDSELKTLAEALGGARPGLMLIVGGAKTGKARLLRELRIRAARYPCRLVPADPSDDSEAPWLVLDRRLSIDDFRRAIAPPANVDGTAEEPTRRDFDLILVYGYRPARGFHEWFTREFLPEGPAARPPRVLVVAGNADDVADLQPLADGQVALGPVPREAVTAELAAIDAAISDRLEEHESEVYTEAIVADLALLGALRQLLPLTRPADPAEHAREEASGVNLEPASKHGRCPCGGVYEDRVVEVRMTVEDELVELTDVPQGACPLCGSRVYKARVLEEIEHLMRGERRA